MEKKYITDHNMEQVEGIISQAYEPLALALHGRCVVKITPIVTSRTGTPHMSTIEG